MIGNGSHGRHPINRETLSHTAHTYFSRHHPTGIGGFLLLNPLHAFRSHDSALNCITGWLSMAYHPCLSLVPWNRSITNHFSLCIAKLPNEHYWLPTNQLFTGSPDLSDFLRHNVSGTLTPITIKFPPQQLHYSIERQMMRWWKAGYNNLSTGFFFVKPQAILRTGSS